MNTQTVTTTPEQVAARAYALWEEEGYPKGREHIHWQEAERQLHIPPAVQPVASRTQGKKPRFRAPKNPVFQA